MTLAPLAEYEAFTDRLGVGADIDELRAMAALDDASTVVRSRARRSFLVEGVVTGVPEALVTITLSVALRVYRNPAGAVNEQTGPFATNYGTAAADPLHLTEREGRTIDAICRPRSGVWVLPISRGLAETRPELDRFTSDPFNEVEA